jgi:defect-in-organelle-trafficking protein DotB
MSLINSIAQHQIIYPEYFNRVLKLGTDMGVSDFYISSQRQIKGRLNGFNKYFTNFDLTPSHVNRLCELIYGSSGVSARLVGDGLPCSYQFKVDKSVYRFRVNMMKSISGSYIVLRPLDGIPPRLSEIGMENEIIDSLVSLCDDRSSVSSGKMFIIAGETGSGKSTSIASLLRYLVEESKLSKKGLNIYTAEAPIEYRFDEVEDGSSVIQQFEKFKGFDCFSGAVRHFMRMDPNIIFVGETRDYETLDSVVQASNTGHVAVTTIHANSVSQIVTRMVDLISSRSLSDIKRVLESIGVAIFQKLLTTSDGKGRVAVREYLVFNNEVNTYLLDNINDLSRATQYCVNNYGRSYDNHIQQLISEGVIDA